MSEDTSPMDYEEHDRTYAGFIEFTKLGIVVCINILVLLALFAFGGGFGVFSGWILLVLMLIASGIGCVMSTNRWIPSAGVLALSAAAALMSLS